MAVGVPILAFLALAGESDKVDDVVMDVMALNFFELAAVGFIKLKFELGVERLDLAGLFVTFKFIPEAALEFVKVVVMFGLEALVLKDPLRETLFVLSFML